MTPATAVVCGRGLELAASRAVPAFPQAGSPLEGTMRRLLVAQIGHATGSGDVARNRHPARVGNGDFDFNGTTTAGGPGNGVPLLADQYPSHERILETEPDLVVGGYASAFDDTTGRGPKTLEASCRRRCHPR